MSTTAAHISVHSPVDNATRWAADGVPPHVIAALLRHSTLSTSAHYVSVSADDLADAVT
jgi:site-specific recombinase XerD